MNFSILYKKTKTEALQFWEISTQGATIITVYGQVGTDSPQRTEDTITSGKNLGKVNATTPETQADAEAQARWEKQVKKGYVENKEGAAKGENELDGVPCMLAHSYAKHSHKITYPAAIQPKLDGIRCIAIVKDGKCTLWSRTRKPITSVPHIIAILEALAKDHGDFVLDGELYNHAYKNDFEKIVSIVRQQKTVAENHTEVQYYVYDLIGPGTFENRFCKIVELLKIPAGKGPVGVVFTTEVPDEAEAIVFFEMLREQGYEGAMLRNIAGLYVPTRSYDLQKVKEMQDAEFPIVGITEGRGKLAGHAIFICKTKEGSEFQVKLEGSLEKLKGYFDNPKTWKDKQLTVQYQKLSAYGVPIFPVGKVVRDYE